MFFENEGSVDERVFTQIESLWEKKGKEKLEASRRRSADESHGLEKERRRQIQEEESHCTYPRKKNIKEREKKRWRGGIDIH